MPLGQMAEDQGGGGAGARQRGRLDGAYQCLLARASWSVCLVLLQCVSVFFRTTLKRSPSISRGGSSVSNGGPGVRLGPPLPQFGTWAEADKHCSGGTLLCSMGHVS